MIGLSASTDYPTASTARALERAAVLFLALLLIAAQARSQPRDSDLELQTLTSERNMLTAELDQYRSTVSLLQTDGTPAEQSANPAVRKLALEMVRIKERLIAVTERELTLLQRQILEARQLAETREQPGERAGQARGGMESKPLRMDTRDHSLLSEEEHVERLRALLAGYYAQLEEAAFTLPSDTELAARAVAELDAKKLERIPFSADKIRLSGAEGSVALGRITRRLTDPDIPESRRDTAPICAIRTRLFGKLIASERRSLRPVGKSNYVARIRLQPGETTLRIKDERWQVHLPENASAGDFLITLYTPPDGLSELHLFAIEDLMAEEDPHIPAWLPLEVNLTPRTG